MHKSKKPQASRDALQDARRKAGKFLKVSGRFVARVARSKAFLTFVGSAVGAGIATALRPTPAK